jgi:hypothetical protein
MSITKQALSQHRLEVGVASVSILCGVLAAMDKDQPFRSVGVLGVLFFVLWLNYRVYQLVKRAESEVTNST